jgi:hypothetical protein
MSQDERREEIPYSREVPGNQRDRTCVNNRILSGPLLEEEMHNRSVGWPLGISSGRNSASQGFMGMELTTTFGTWYSSCNFLIASRSDRGSSILTSVKVLGKTVLIGCCKMRGSGKPTRPQTSLV